MLTRHDYVLLPEGGKMAEKDRKIFDSTGATPLVIYLGQHTKDLSNVGGTKLFKPICLTQYFASLYFCSFNAHMDTPMNPKFIELSDRLKPYKKENLILYDPDPSGKLNVSKIELPKGYKMLPVQGCSFDEVVRLYSKAKIYLDSFLTGRERGLFESALFNVIPISAFHAGANTYQDYPIMNKWLWKIFNYTHLNSLIEMATLHYEDAVRDFEPLRSHVMQMDLRFTKQIEDYFSHDFGIILSAFEPRSTEILGKVSANAMLNLLISRDLFPFASAEVVCIDSFNLHFEFAEIFRELKEYHHAYDVRLSELDSGLWRKGDMAIFLHNFSSIHDRYLFILNDGIVHNRIGVKLLMNAIKVDYDIAFADGMVAARFEVIDYLKSRLLNESVVYPEGFIKLVENRFRFVYQEELGRTQSNFCDNFEKVLAGNYLRRYLPSLENHYYVREILQHARTHCGRRVPWKWG
ncbi:hypothetical protein M9434_002478 [Picochlorum sp. BPE23]|nr:hypothetical protein M9434_002478 [Picochlorum sp. BPE23]